MMRDRIYKEEIAVFLINELLTFYTKYYSQFQEQMAEIVKDIKGTPKFDVDIFREEFGAKFLNYHNKKPYRLGEWVQHITVLVKGLLFFYGGEWINELGEILESVKNRRSTP